MARNATVVNDVIALLRQRPQGVVARDIKDFRSKLSTKGISTEMLEEVLRTMRNHGTIRLKSCPSGTHVKLCAD